MVGFKGKLKVKKFLSWLQVLMYIIVLWITMLMLMLMLMLTLRVLSDSTEVGL